MNFDEIMEFGGEANRVTYQKIKEAIRKRKLIPFVGAGLSKEAGYPLWPEALKQLVKFAEPAKRAEIERLIDTDPEEAADRIEESIGGKKMHDYLADIFGEKADLNTRHHTVGMLPYLFPSQLTITTNFDRVVENAFQKTKGITLEKAVPSNPYVSGKTLSGEIGDSIYKVHGDVYSEYINIVFSKTSYNRHYTGATPVTQALDAVFLARQLFFLGCSLQKDRTLRLLKSLQTRGTHFAIINEEPDNVWNRRKELSEDCGIDAIIYPVGKHECVKIILSRLLEDTDPDAFRVCPACQTPVRSSMSRLVYQSRNTDFIGRDEEFEELLRFIAGDDRAVTWWALSGPGGSGKSRLVDELKRHMENHMPAWHALTFDRSEKITPGLLDKRIRAAGGNAFIAIDYMQTGLGPIGEWIAQNSTGTRRVRVLFLQRDGIKLLDQDLHPFWLQEILNAPGNLRNSLWQPSLLYLEPWKDPETIKRLMRSYAAHVQRPGELDAFLDELCDTLRKRDEKLMLPLFAMFIADAKLEGNDPCQWDAEQLLQWFCKKEQDIHRKQLEGIQESLGGCFQNYENLIVLATIANSWQAPETTADAYLPYRELIHAICSSLHLLEPSAVERCVEWGLLIPNGGKGTYTLQAVEPDPFGEFYVLEYLRERFQEKTGRTAIEMLVKEVSKNPDAGEEFFSRLFSDYGEYLEEHLQALKDCLYSLNDWLKKAFDISIAQRVLNFAVFAFQKDLSTSKSAMDKAGDIIRKYNKNTMASWVYAQGLVNLSIDQDAEGSAYTVGLLRGIAERFPASQEIALEYAQGLFNLSVRQGAEGCASTVEWLCGIAERFPASQEIALEYAKGLVNLSNRQNAEGRASTVGLLRGIADRFPASQEIALAYAKGLVNLSADQNAEGRASTVGLLRGIAERFPASQEIALAYARGLFNLSARHDTEGCASTVGLLRGIADRFPASQGIALAYAKGLVNLSADQNAEGCASTVGLLRGIVERFPASEEIALAYAQGLFNLSNRQDAEGFASTVGLLRGIADRFPASQGIALAYAKGLVNLSADQNAEGCASTVGLLRGIVERFPASEEIALAYAQGLFNLSNRQDAEGFASTVGLLHGITDRFPASEEIALRYAQGLFNLSVDQDAEGRASTVGLLRGIADRFPASQEIALEYAKGLVNLSAKQDVEGCASTVGLLRGIADRFPASEEIALRYAQGLFNLSFDQDAEGRASTVGLLHGIVERFPKNEEIAELFDTAKSQNL